MILAQVIFLLIVLIFEVVLLQLIVQLLELKSLTGKPVDSTGDQLLLDVLAELVVKLKALLDVTGGVIVLLLGGRLGGVEEVEERLGLDSLLDNASLLGVCNILSVGSCGLMHMGAYSCSAASCSQFGRSDPCRPSSQSCHPRRGRR